MLHVALWVLGRVGGRTAAAALTAGAVLAGPPDVAAQDRPVELELVLAVDASASVQRDEFDLQVRGLAQAFRHPAVLAALDALDGREVAVTVVQWSSPGRQHVAIPWMRIGDRAGAAALSAKLARMPRYVTSGGTATGQAIAFARGLFGANGYRGARRVIDVSGDGRANMGRHPSAARDDAAAAGVTINGLAILNEEKNVDRYYAEHVIGGPGAFLMTAADYGAFARAIRRKLVREITGSGIAALPGGPEPRSRIVGRSGREAAAVP